MRIVIAERDNHERVAIEWLISTYSIPINNVIAARTVKETLAIVEKEMPEILYLELDMISAENWSIMMKYVQSYSPRVIAVTAEATFERAKQAIELGSVDLLVKPLDPVKVKDCLRMAWSLVSSQKKINDSSPYKEEGYSYRSLFLDQELNNGDLTLVILHAENKKKYADLLEFLTCYPFREYPKILPLADLVVCLFNQTQYIREEVSKFLREWESFNIEPLAAVIIPPNHKMKTVHEMYESARSLLEMTFFIGYRQVILPKEGYESWQEIDPFLTSAEQREWVEMLKSFDKQKIKNWMHQEFLHMETPFPNPEKLRTRLTSILAQVRRFMKAYQLDHGEMEDYYIKIFAEILYNRVLYRIVQEMLLFLYELLDQAKNSDLFSKKDVIERGLLYIEKHYTNPNLTLEDVAEAVGRSTAYYSHLLMKRQGMSFRQHLANKRISEAKRLLYEGRLSIKQIAYQVGFRNPSYFTRIFKEMTNMAPREYRLHKLQEME